MADLHIFLLYGFIAMAAGIAVLGTYLGKRENNSVYTGLFLFVVSGLWISLFVATDRIIIDNAEASKITENITQLIPYNITSHSSSATVINATGGSEIRAESILANSVLINQNIDCMIIELSITGNPASTVIAGIFDNNGNVVQQFGTIETSSLTTSFIPYVFCNAFTYTIQENDFIGVASTGGIAGNLVNIRVDTNNPFDGTNTQLDSFVNGVWVDATPATDIKMLLTFRTNQIIETTTTEPIYAPFDTEIKFMFLAIAAFAGLIGATTVNPNRGGGFKPFDKID